MRASSELPKVSELIASLLCLYFQTKIQRYLCRRKYIFDISGPCTMLKVESLIANYNNEEQTSKSHQRRAHARADWLHRREDRRAGAQQQAEREQ